uniref:Protease Do-like 5, chloroplastic n=1 Tax=Leersia perrieri TaxID=77586 RepID=A0A0D9Y1H5_9ORYZ
MAALHPLLRLLLLRPPPPPPPTSPPFPTTRRSSFSGAAAVALLLLAGSPPPPPARADIDGGGEDIDESRVVRLFQEASPSVVFIKDLVVGRNSARESGKLQAEGGDDGEEEGATVEGTGSGFVWDTAGHIVFLEDSSGTSYSKEGTLVGCDPSYDLAVLKVDVDGDRLRPALIGTSKGLRVGQSCFAIGNPYGYEHTLTTGVVSGLGREIPSPNGRPIRGAIQTDAAINSGNSGGPLIDSYGHVIGVNTATFTRKGTGISSGVNFAIPIDTVVQSVPNLIVYGTSVSNRF